VLVEIDRKSIKKMFPNLVRELEQGDSENDVKIDSVRADAASAEESLTDAEEITVAEAKEALPDKFRHYNPTVVDFIRRCDNCAQAEEIVEYLLKRGELSDEYASEIRSQLKKKGIRSFGTKKEDDYYFKQGGIL
jgi:hypothetical protein